MIKHTKRYLSNFHLILVGFVLAYLASQGIRGFTLAILASTTCVILFRPPDMKFIPSQAKSFGLVIVIVVSILLFSAIQYMFYQNYPVFQFCVSFFMAFGLGVLLLYFRGRETWKTEFFTLILSFVCGVLVFNLLITIEIPRDQILKEGLGGVVRALTIRSGGVVYHGVFLIENHIVIPYASCIGLTLCGAAICLKGAFKQSLVVLVGVFSLFPAYYTSTRAPFVVLAVLVLVVCLASLWRGKNVVLVTVMMISGLILAAVLVQRDISLLTRLINLKYDDARLILWGGGLAKLMGSEQNLLISSYAHNYVLDLGLDFGRGLAIVALLMLGSILVACARLFLKLDLLNFKDACIIFFLFVGVLISMVNPPSTLSHMVYGFGLASLPYLNYLASMLRDPERHQTGYDGQRFNSLK